MSERMLIAEVVQRLTRRYAQLPPDQISAAVHTAHARFEHSPIRDLVPLLVERGAPVRNFRDTPELIKSAR